ncbi:MAG: HEAT repeat domain-containing protein [candidate division WOR-3 bacterium]
MDAKKWQIHFLIPLLLIVLISFCGMPPKERAEAILKKGLEDRSAAVKIAAARGLAEIGDENGYNTLYQTLQSDNKEAMVAALGALYELKEQSLSPILKKLCVSDDPLIRTEAYHLVATIKDTAGYRILMAGTKDKISKVRRYSYQGLANFKDKKAIIPGLKDNDPLVRIYAAKSLALLGENQAVNLIKKEMDPKNPNVEVWSQAVLALAEINDTSAIPYIKELLTDTPWDLKIAAAQALLMLHNTEGIEVLKAAVQSPDPFVRVKGAEAMKKFPLLEFYELLKKATGDDYINVSIAAIEGLRLYHKKEDLKIFAELFSAPNPLVRIAAATAYLKNTTNSNR